MCLCYLTPPSVSVFQPIFFRLLYSHVHNTDAIISTSYTVLNHIAALLNLMAAIAEKDIHNVQPYLQLVLNVGLPKWISQFETLNRFKASNIFELVLIMLLDLWNLLIN